MKTYLELSDIALMEGAAQNPRDHLLIRLLSHLACRISEALAIKVGDIDFERSTITIVHLKRIQKVSCPKCDTRLGNRHRHCPGCGDKIEGATKQMLEKRRVRVLPADEITLSRLKAYLQGNPGIGSGSRIFSINRHRAWQIVRECATRAGLSPLVNPETGRARGISPHRLRDAFSVHAMKTNDSGDGLRLLQEHLGHQSFATTARYRKIAGEEHRRWFDRLWQ